MKLTLTTTESEFRCLVHLDETKLVAKGDPRTLGDHPLTPGTPDPDWCVEHVFGTDVPQGRDGVIREVKALAELEFAARQGVAPEPNAPPTVEEIRF